MSQTIQFSLPNFVEFKNINLCMTQLLNEKREWFYDDISIGSCYGAFPPSIWNSEIFVTGYMSADEIMADIEVYNAKEIAIRYTYENTLLTVRNLNDTFCNACLQYASGNALNQVSVNSSVLEGHIREVHPKLHLVSSMSKELKSIQLLNSELEKNYELVEVDYSLNKDEQLFSGVANKAKCELLLNTQCRDHCKYRKQHYDSVSKQQLLMGYDGFECPYDRDEPLSNNLYELMEKNESFIRVEELYEKYVPAGFCHFRIAGRRQNDFEMIEPYIYYMAKPEYRNIARQQLLFNFVKCANK